MARARRHVDADVVPSQAQTPARLEQEAGLPYPCVTLEPQHLGAATIREREDLPHLSQLIAPAHEAP